MVGEPQVLRQIAIEIGHRLRRIAVEHVEHGDRGDEAVVVAAADRRVEEEVAGLLEAGQRVEIAHAPLDVGMAGLPIVDLDAAEPMSSGSVAKRPVDLTSTTKVALRVQLGEVARQHHADLVGEDLVRLRRRPRRSGRRRRRSRARRRRRCSFTAAAIACSMSQILGVGIVTREGEVELAIERDDFGAERGEQLRREGARRAVAAGGDDLHLARPLRPRRQVGEVAGGKVVDEFVAAARAVAGSRRRARCRAGAPFPPVRTSPAAPRPS